MGNTREEKDLQKETLKKMVIGIYISIITLNMNGLNAPTKRHRLAEDTKTRPRASLVAQWLRICLPMQGTQVRALVWEDPTCRGATGPVSHNY